MPAAQVRDSTGSVVFEGSREHAETHARLSSEDGSEYDVFHRDRGKWFHVRTFCNGDAQ